MRLNAGSPDPNAVAPISSAPADAALLPMWAADQARTTIQSRMGWGTPEWVRNGCEALLASLLILEATSASNGIAARFAALLAAQDVDDATARLRTDVESAVGDIRSTELFVQLSPGRRAAVLSTLQEQVFRPAAEEHVAG